MILLPFTPTQHQEEKESNSWHKNDPIVDKYVQLNFVSKLQYYKGYLFINFLWLTNS